MTSTTTATAMRGGPDEPATPALWAALTAPFPEDEHELKPQILKRGDEVKYQCRQGTQASVDGVACGGYHARAVHLTYVGHAGVTMRLNAVDPWWSWEPVATDERGLPISSDGGLWIRLTVLGVTRLGFGDAQGKGGPNAIKEIIGDAIRNAGLRFGIATYLWSKSEKSQAIASREGADEDPAQRQQQRQEAPRGPSERQVAEWTGKLARAAAEAFGSPNRQALVGEVWEAAKPHLSLVVDIPEPWQPAVGSSRAMLGDLARCIAQDSRIATLPEETP